MEPTNDPPKKPDSSQDDDFIEADLIDEWEGMDETDAANAEYEHELMQRDD